MYTLQAGIAWVITRGGGRVIDTPYEVGRPGGPVARVGGRLTARARTALRDHGYEYDRAARCWAYAGGR